MFKDAIATVAKEKIGRRRGSKRENWIQDKTWLLIDEQKKAKSMTDRARSAEVMKLYNERYKELNKAVKKSCLTDKNEWFKQKGEETQNAVCRNDTKTLYRIIRDLNGSQSNSNVPIKDKNGKVLLTIEEQTNRWVEHFKEVLNQPHPEILHDFDTETADKQFDVSLENFSEENVTAAVQKLKNNKAPGLDNIISEMLKNGGECSTESLTSLLNNCWQHQLVPEEWRKGMIVKLPKKGSFSNCINWRSITLLSIPGKVVSIIQLNRLKDSIDLKLREQQAGFRSN